MRGVRQRPARPEAVVPPVGVLDEQAADALVLGEQGAHLVRRRHVVEVVDAQVGAGDAPGADVALAGRGELAVELHAAAGPHPGVLRLQHEHRTRVGVGGACRARG